MNTLISDQHTANPTNWRPSIRTATETVILSQRETSKVDPATVHSKTISAAREALSRTIVESIRPMKPCWARDRNWTKPPEDAELVAVFRQVIAVESIDWNDAIAFDWVLGEVQRTVQRTLGAR
jgi:hypothetical protein